MNPKLKQNCDRGKHRLRDNKFGVTWCIDCGLLSTKPSGKPFFDGVNPNAR